MSPGLCLIAHERAVSATESDKLLSDHARAGGMLTCAGARMEGPGRWMWTKRGSQATRSGSGRPVRSPRPALVAALAAPGCRAVYAVAFGLDGDPLAAVGGNGFTYLWHMAGGLAATFARPAAGCHRCRVRAGRGPARRRQRRRAHLPLGYGQRPGRGLLRRPGQPHRLCGFVRSGRPGPGRGVHRMRRLIFDLAGGCLRPCPRLRQRVGEPGTDLASARRLLLPSGRSCSARRKTWAPVPRPDGCSPIRQCATPQATAWPGDAATKPSAHPRLSRNITIAQVV
jgi:hypothetical protein